MEINQGSFCLRLVKKTDGLLVKDTVKSLVMDPPFIADSSAVGTFSLCSNSFCVFLEQRKTSQKKG